MINKNGINDKKHQVQMFSLDELVPKDHLLRKIDKYVDFTFIYDLVEDRYSHDVGRPSVDPVTLIKIPMIQYLYGIKSMRQTIKEIEVNVAYRWFLGLGLTDKVPHFSTFGKNYTRRFEGTDLFEQIFQGILLQCINHSLVKTDVLFVDATHVKAAANRRKADKVIAAKKQARFYEEQLLKEINEDRVAHGKKEFEDRDKDDDNNIGPPSSITPDNSKKYKEQKQSKTDPESGWFHKGDHKEEFAYGVQSVCERNGWVLGYSIHPGNEHDSRTFISLYEKVLSKLDAKAIVMDAGYKIPAIAKLLIDNGIAPVFPYKRPMTKKGFFRKNEFVYDEQYDCYICPENQILRYSTTNRDGYREYKSCGITCQNCPMLEKCTASANHTKIIARHIWEDYMEECEEIRQTNGMREIYNLRKETIERTFGTAKEHHAMRYTQQIGKEKMSMKIGLTFACMNMKKLAKMLSKREGNGGPNPSFFDLINRFFEILTPKPRFA